MTGHALRALATVSGLAADGLADRRTIKARIKEYDVPLVKREGRGDYHLVHHVVEAFQLQAAGLAPDNPLARRIGWLWILETYLARGEPLTLDQLDAWAAEVDEAPRGPARPDGNAAPATPGAHDGRERIDGTGRQQPAAAETARWGDNPLGGPGLMVPGLQAPEATGATADRPSDRAGRLDRTPPRR